jgi:hypothetical protein
LSTDSRQAKPVEPHGSDQANHAAYVEAWLRRAAPNAKSLPPARLVSLFDRAMGALWQRAETTLGEVTLAAIVDRVLYTASEQHPFLSTLTVVEAGVSFGGLREEGAVPRDVDLAGVVSFVLAEFLTILGKLTDEILTPALHGELATITLEEPGTPGATERDDDDDAKEGVRGKRVTP